MKASHTAINPATLSCLDRKVHTHTNAQIPYFPDVLSFPGVLLVVLHYRGVLFCVLVPDEVGTVSCVRISADQR